MPLYSSPRAVVADREAHRGWLRIDTELVEQRDEVRVRAVVENDEAGVDGVRFAVDLDAVRVRVPAGTGVGLEHGDLVPRAVQAMGDDVARDPRTDHRDLHARDSGRVASRTAAGTVLKSRISPAHSSSRNPYHVRSNSHQKNPWRAAAG